jgi:hypothetical protein
MLKSKRWVACLGLKSKVIMSLLIFSGLFVFAWWVNQDMNRYSNISNKQSDFRILRSEEIEEVDPTERQLFEPFRPREYIRVRKRIIRD